MNHPAPDPRPTAGMSLAERALHPGYLSGFGNGFETEALPGALPIGRNSPQRCPYGLYAEQLSGSPFTAPRTTNERSWLYRIRPTVAHWSRFRKRRRPALALRSRAAEARTLPIAPLRWDPLPIPDHAALLRRGHAHASPPPATCARRPAWARMSMSPPARWQDEYFYNADGEMLVLPQQGAAALLHRVRPHRRGARRGGGDPARREDPRRAASTAPARGYVCENYGGAFSLPERGPIGANCLANPRDFLTPVAAFEDRDAPGRMIVKWGGTLWAAEIDAFAARRGRLARQLRALQIRSAPILAGRPGAVRPCRPVDLHRADLALRDAGHGEHRFRAVLRSLARRRGHVPPALVPHERHERVHGPDLPASTTPRPAAASCPAASRCTIACCRTGRTATRSSARATPS